MNEEFKFMSAKTTLITYESLFCLSFPPGHISFGPIRILLSKRGL